MNGAPLLAASDACRILKCDRGGGLQLWEAGMARLGTVVPCAFNTGVLLAICLCIIYANSRPIGAIPNH